MSHIVKSPDPDEPVEIDLKNPWLALLLAWLWPGAGHIYQGRQGKGFLYMACILILFFWGLLMSGGHAVYASFKPEDLRLSYLCQLPVGIPALPAIAQNIIINRMPTDDPDNPPPFGYFMAPPRNFDEQSPDLVASWHRDYKLFFELGLAYTMIAGLLNVLAIYDAWAGPLFNLPETWEEETPPAPTPSPPAATPEPKVEGKPASEPVEKKTTEEPAKPK